MKIAQEKTQAPYPDLMVDFNGQKKKNNREKVDAFAKTFVKKTQEVVSNVKIKFFHSRLYYGAKIWLSSALSVTLKKKLWPASSKMLKICQKDWQGHYSSRILHKILCRATPEMW